MKKILGIPQGSIEQRVFIVMLECWFSWRGALRHRMNERHFAHSIATHISPTFSEYRIGRPTLRYVFVKRFLVCPERRDSERVIRSNFLAYPLHFRVHSYIGGGNSEPGVLVNIQPSLRWHQLYFARFANESFVPSVAYFCKSILAGNFIILCKMSWIWFWIIH